MAAATKVISFNSPAQALPAVEAVSQAELVELIEHQNLLVQLKDKLSELEFGIKSRLEAGAAVQPGVHVATLEEHLRRSPSWKDVVKRLAERLDMDGDAYCSNVLVHTKPTRTVTLEVR